MWTWQEMSWSEESDFIIGIRNEGDLKSLTLLSERVGEVML